MSAKDIFWTWAFLVMFGGLCALAWWGGSHISDDVLEWLAAGIVVVIAVPIITILFWPYGLMLRSVYEDWRDK